MRTTKTVVLAVLAVAWCSFAAAQTIRVALNVKPQPMSAALKDFGAQTGMQVLFRAEDVASEGITAPGVSGELSVQEALDRLLANSGLKYELVNKRTVRVAKEEAPEVPGADGAGEGSKSSEAPEAGNGEGQVKAEGQGSSAGNEGERTYGGELDEIVVTAQKREERIQDVPMSVSAISGDALNAAGISNAHDLAYVVPGLAVTETGPGRQIIAIRGIASIRGNSSLTGVYLDEMPASGVQDGFISAYADLRTIDLERVEVLKGPQGTLFGEGAAGGVLRFITKDPDLTRIGGEIGTEFYSTSDSGMSEEVTGVFNLPLVQDVFGIRLAAKYENTAGWIDQPAGIPAPSGFLFGDPNQPVVIGQPSLGREDINDAEVAHFRLKALYAPTDALRIKAMAEIHRNDGGASNLVNYGFDNSNFVQAFDRNASTEYFDDYDMFNLAVTYDFSFAQLLSSSSYAEFNSEQSWTQFLDGDTVPWQEILVERLQQRATLAAQEFRLVSSTPGPFNWVVGGTYKSSKLKAGYPNSGVDVVLFGGALVFSDLGVGSEPANYSKSWASFADVSYEFTDRFELGGGLRYFSEDRESFDALVFPRTSQEGEWSKTTYRAYVKYSIAENAAVYANVGSGFRSGGFNGANVVSLGGPAAFEPETTLFYELGAKLSLVDGRVRLNAAVFHGEFQDMFADRLEQTPSGVFGYTANGQNAEVKGFEMDLAWAATERLTLNLAGGVTDTEITEVDTSVDTPAYSIGDPISLVPKYNVSASVDYGFNWIDAVPGFFRLSADRKGKQHFVERSNGLLIETLTTSPEVTFLNASVGGEWNGWTFSLFGRNLLDERRALNAAPTGWTTQARPLTVGVTLGKSF